MLNGLFAKWIICHMDYVGLFVLDLDQSHVKD